MTSYLRSAPLLQAFARLLHREPLNGRLLDFYDVHLQVRNTPHTAYRRYPEIRSSWI
jgi:hypothetical protein